jgi:hypothetical protein
VRVMRDFPFPCRDFGALRLILCVSGLDFVARASRLRFCLSFPN